MSTPNRPLIQFSVTPEELRRQAANLRPVQHQLPPRSTRGVPPSRYGSWIESTPRRVVGRSNVEESPSVRDRIQSLESGNQAQPINIEEREMSTFQPPGSERQVGDPTGLFQQQTPSYLHVSPDPNNHFNFQPPPAASTPVTQEITPPPPYQPMIYSQPASVKPEKRESMSPYMGQIGTPFHGSHPPPTHLPPTVQPSVGQWPSQQQYYLPQNATSAFASHPTPQVGSENQLAYRNAYFSQPIANPAIQQQVFAANQAYGQSQQQQPQYVNLPQPGNSQQNAPYYTMQPAANQGYVPPPMQTYQPISQTQYYSQPQQYSQNQQQFYQQQQPYQQQFTQPLPSVNPDPTVMMSQVLQQQNQQTRCIVSRQSHASRLPNFEGNPLDWPLFHHRYMQSTRDCMYSPSENVARLSEALKGEAKRHIQPLLITPNTNPDVIIAKLQQRFGKPQYVIQALVEAVRKMPPPKESKLHTVLDFASAICNLVMTIKSLQVEVHLYNPQLLKELVDKLPDSLKLQWGMMAMERASTSLEDFSNWIDGIANAASYVTTPDFSSFKKKTTGGESLFATTADSQKGKGESGKKPLCHVCSKDHLVASCPLLEKMTVDDRWKKVKSLSLCFRCLQPRCNMFVCKSRKICEVDGCKRRHHHLLHGSSVGKKPEEPSPNANKSAREVNGCVNAPKSTSVLLRIMPVALHGPGGKITVNALLDEASTVTMLSKEIADQLDLRGCLDPLRLNWTNGASQTDNASRKVTLHISPLNSQVKFRMEGVRTVKSMNLPVQNVDYQDIVSSHPHLKGLKLQVLPEDKPVLLIGQPHIHLTVARKVKEGSSSEPVATETRLGWVLHGPTGGSEPAQLTFSCFHETDSDIMHRLVKESFSLDSVGIRSYATQRSKEDLEAEKKMQAITRRVNNRWETGLLWRKEPVDIRMSTAELNSAKEKEVSRSTAVGDPVGSACTTAREEQPCSGATMGEDQCRQASIPSECRISPAPPDTSLLPPSFATAYRRLLGVEKRLQKHENMKEEFKMKIEDYVAKGYARKLSMRETLHHNAKQWFLPIFPVFNPNKPGKMRLVFDAASQSHGKSLNDFLLTGPDLLVSLPGMLLNFRLRKIAFSGDIAEMFHQVLIRKEDQPSQRFLWREYPSEPPDVYQLQVMMFGSVCSPFCAQYIRNQNAVDFMQKLPKAANAVQRKHYMDDYVDSTDTVEEAVEIISQVAEIHQSGGFHIGKWISNSTAVLQSIKPEDRVAGAKDLSCWSEIPTERALGLHWNPSEDYLLFKLNVNRAGEGVADGSVVPTKRAILRLIMLVWDPLGLLSHYMIKARILLQQVWREKVGWDDEIPSTLYGKWKSWVRKLPEVERIRLPRCYHAEASASREVQLHVFADASEVAYCAVAYLRIVTNEGEVITTFLMSKSRVAPLKPASIPRLELQAALIAVRMGKFIMESLEVPISSVTYWTDSATVLKWIRSEARRFQQFISNRVGEIHESSDVSSWRWVPSKFNVADDATREGKCDLSENSRWWTGPEFLRTDFNEWPEEEEHEDLAEEELELRKEFAAVVVESPSFSYLPDVSRFSNFMRIVRASAYVLLALKKFRGEKDDNLPTARAEDMLLRRSQWEDYTVEMYHLTNNLPLPASSKMLPLSPVLDEYGVLRMQSRLHSAEELGLRQPVILNKSNPLTAMLIMYEHRRCMHQGEETVKNELRQRYWIPRLRTAIRSVLRTCRFCQRRKLTGMMPRMGNLPAFRINRQSRAFTWVGLDYFGPALITVKRSRVKVYGVIFTCLTTRAIHLEIASDLSTDACIMAIRRMTSRRGDPVVIMSDNGTNLKGADNELKKCVAELNQKKLKDELSVQGIDWKFIPPHSPHFGSTWERMVRSVKTALAAVLKEQAPKEETLQTLFAEVEAIINSRPLTDVPADPDAPEALTPFHFLIGSSSKRQPPGIFDDKDLLLNKRWRQAQTLTDMFWRRWVREYVPTLQQRKKWHHHQPNLQVGDVVVIFDESLRRGTWPLGIVISTSPGKDGVVRVVTVKTATGIYTRPAVKVGKLGIRTAEEQERNFGEIEGENIAAVEGSNDGDE